MLPGPLIIVSGPSATGKSTLIERLLEGQCWPLRLSVSVTTRPARPSERDGVHYHYWTRDRFEQEIQAGGFLEWAEVHDNFYGSLQNEVAPYRARCMGVLLDIDVKGREQVKAKCPEVVSVFIRTSSLRVLEQRLRGRGTETEEAIQGRLRGAAAELARAPEYDHQIINDNLDAALAQLRAIVGPLFER